ncbi:MAG TPA: ABC transporter permease subunit [Clostridiaceae bacterium]
MQSFIKYLKRDKLLYLMLVPGIAFFIIFKYVPMYGILIAFKEYSFKGGITGSPWVGLKYFNQFFGSPDFGRVMGNTIKISLYKLIIGFPAPIIFAMLLNEVRNSVYKRTIQTVVYLPHFLSWVVIGNLVIILLAPKSGLISGMLTLMTGKEINLLMNPDYFRGVLVLSDMWKELGWSTIIYLAALNGVDPNLYEAADIDGANGFQSMIHITLPSIRSVVIIMLILRVGYILDAGFEQVLIMSNALVNDVSEIIDTYVYKIGLLQAQYSLSTAVNLFKSAIGLCLVVTINKIAKRWGEELW